jgi:hypothetical protein
MDMKKITKKIVEKLAKIPIEELKSRIAQHADDELVIAFRELDEFSTYLREKHKQPKT